MVFSDTTNIENGHIQACEDHCGFYNGEISGDSTKLRQFTRRLNMRQAMAQAIILDASPDIDLDDPNYGDRPTGTFALTTGRAFGIPVSEKMLRIKRIDFTYDGSNWYRGTRTDSSQFEFGLGNESAADTHFTNTEPRYDLEGNAVVVYPRATSAQVSAGASARIEWTRAFEEFSDTGDDSKESGLDSNFQPYLDIGASHDWLLSYRPKAVTTINGLAAQIQQYESMMRSHYSNKHTDTPLVANSIVGIDDYK